MIEDIGIYEILNDALTISITHISCWETINENDNILSIQFINGNNYYDMYWHTNYSVHVSFWCNGSRCWNIV